MRAFANLAAVTALVVAASAPALAQVPAHPRELKFEPLSFTPPDAAKHRRVL